MLAEAEVLAEMDPNSALTIIEKIDSLHIHFGGESHARLALVGTKTRYRCFQAVKDDTLIHDAVRYFQKHGNDKELGEGMSREEQRMRLNHTKTQSEHWKKQAPICC